MAPGVQLLVQWAVEFAPVVVALIRKSLEAGVLESNARPTVEGQGAAGLVQQKLWQQELAAYRRETLLKVAAHQRETALKLPEVDRILEHWPLRLYPSQILQSHNREGPSPLRVFLGFPAVRSGEDSSLAGRVARLQPRLVEGLRAFLNAHYSLHDPQRPTEFLPGAWQNERFHSEASIKALFGLLKSEPTLVIESEIEGDRLYLRLAYWGLNQSQYFYRTIAALPCWELLQASARSRALAWKSLAQRLIAAGEDPAEVERLGQDNPANLALLERIERWQEQGIDVGTLKLEYHLAEADFEALSRLLVTCHCLVAAWVADAYWLGHHDVAPRLPALLQELVRELPDLQLLEALVAGYRQMYQAVEAERRYWIPELALQLAESLVHLSDRSWAEEQIRYSLSTWLELRGLGLSPEEDWPEAMQAVLGEADRDYLQRLLGCFVALADEENAQQVRRLLAWLARPVPATLPRGVLPLRTLATGDGAAVAALAASPDGRLIATGGTDRLVQLWDATSGRLVHTLRGHAGAIAAVAFSPDGRLLVSGSSDDRRQNLKVWRVEEGRLVATLFGHNKPVHHLAVAPSGRLLASCSNKVKIWNLSNGERVGILWHGSAVHSVCISPDGQLLVSAGEDCKVKLWNLESRELLRVLSGHGGAVQALAVGCAGRLLASGDAEGHLRLWNPAQGSTLHVLAGHSGAVRTVAFSADGTYLASGGSEGRVHLWDPQKGTLLHVLEGHSGPVCALVFFEGNTLASGGADGTVRLWQLS